MHVADRYVVPLLVLLLQPLAFGHGGHTLESKHFAYDASAAVVEARMLPGSTLYSPGLASVGDVLWIAYLEFVPGEGDHVWVGRLDEGEVVEARRVTGSAGRYANPTLTKAGDEDLWLSYEVQPDDASKWQIHARRIGGEKAKGAVAVSDGQRHGINHRVAADSAGGIWVTWQGEQEGQYDVFAREAGADGALGPIQRVSSGVDGDWSPSVAVTPNGDVCVVWDTYTGESFDVLCRWFAGGKWGPVRTVADGPAFQGRGDVVCDGRGWVWVLWEEGAEGWGKPFRGVEHEWTNITDGYGPVHRFRKVHVARLERDGSLSPLAEPLPMPSFEAARQQERRRPGAEQLGVFYERGKLAVDASDRLWVAYRHYFAHQAAMPEPTEHHVEVGWAVYARCIEGEGWSPLHSFDIHQRDGMQRLAIVPHGDGLAAAWATGRTDRRKDPMPRGIATGVLPYQAGSAANPAFGDTTALVAQAPPSDTGQRPPEAGVGGKTYRLFYGDLHRHTDLSLCFPFFDGSIEDAYRYAIEVAGLDFLGVTDHTRDIDHGDALSQLWWRSTKEARRHVLDGAFATYFSFERSHRDTDHNVISLRDDMIRDFPPPLWDYWAEIGPDTFTIPHTHFNGTVWDRQDDAKRPLLEIYQGCRDYHSQKDAHDGLDRGYHMGFIASSDHLSTSASYACVWAPEATRESIFRAMQARRTFGATDHIRLVFKSGAHWMGERIVAAAAPTFQVSIQGTAPIELLQVFHNGEVVQTLETGAGAGFETEFTPQATLTGGDYFYLYLRQKDGNQAWSSPIWVEKPAG